MSGRSRPLARLGRWLLLTGPRPAVALVGLVGIYLVLDPLGHVLVRSGTTGGGHAATPLLTTLLSGVFLVVTIVVSVNSLVVSGEQTPLGRQFERIREGEQFRRELESLTDVTASPAEPDRFLRVLTGGIVTHAQRVEDVLEEADADPELRADIDEYLEELAAVTEDVNGRLEDADSTLDLVVATLDYDYTARERSLRRIRDEHRDALPDEADPAIEEILTLLRYFATTGEYFKTLYFRREFSGLSNGLVAVSLPAIAVVSFVLLHAGQVPQAHWFLVGVTTVALAPFALLSAHVVRAATVARRTRATGQFVLGD